MDYGKDYIEMCEKAEEIQLLRREESHLDTDKWQDGDFWTTVFNTDGRDAFVAYRGNDAWADVPHYLPHPFECIWLPRQDQLQIISGLSWKQFDIECQEYNTDTKEQAGIRVVMKCKFKKNWSHGDWSQLWK